MPGRITLAFLVAMAAAAQQEPSFRAGTDLVQVSVVAQDKDGNAVTDLRREDFQILDNDTQQEIRLFLLQKPDMRAPEAKTPGVFTNRPDTERTVAHSVFLFDNLNIVDNEYGNTTFEHTARARIKALAALRAIPPGDEIAIYALWCQFQVVRDWTADRDSMLAALGKFAPAPAGCRKPDDPKLKEHSIFEYQHDPAYAQYAATRYNTAPTTAEFGIGLRPPAETLGAEDARSLRDIGIAMMMIGFTNRQVSMLADYLAGIPGRKNLIWLSTTFALFQSTVRKLIDADVVIYPIDTLGSAIALKTFKDERAAKLQTYATASGGMSYTDRDDLDAAIAQAMTDGRASYILGFYSTESGRNLSAHRVTVRVNRPGVTLRYRTTYSVEAPPPKSTSPVRDVVLAMNRPVDATAIGITASATHAGPSRLNLSVTFDTSNLNLALDRGQWNGNAEVVARFVTGDDRQAGAVIARTMTFHLKSAPRGATLNEQLTIPPKAIELNLAISNLANGKIGTLRIPLSEMP